MRSKISFFFGNTGEILADIHGLVIYKDIISTFSSQMRSCVESYRLIIDSSILVYVISCLTVNITKPSVRTLSSKFRDNF